MINLAIAALYHHMKKKHYLACLLFAASAGMPQLYGHPLTPLAPALSPSLFAEEETNADEGPSEELIRKLAAMMPEQKFKRSERQISKGGTAPEGTAVYPVQILNADDSVAFDANFFQEASGKWALFDNHGNVAREQ